MFDAIYGESLTDKDYVLELKKKCNGTLECIRKFIYLKFGDFGNNSEVKKFVNMKIDLIGGIVIKMNNRIEKAREVYQKHKEKIKSLESDRENSNKK